MHKLNKAVAKAEARAEARPDPGPGRSASTSVHTRDAGAVSLTAIDDMLRSGKEKVLTKLDAVEASVSEVVKGQLRKKSGGQRDTAVKARLKQNWRKRFFVLSSSTLTYYKHQSAYESGKTELGRLDVRGCIVPQGGDPARHLSLHGRRL